MAGVVVPPNPYTLAPTPPPDIDVEAWERSLDVIAAWEPERLALTHFGAVEDPPEQLERVRATLREQARLAGEHDQEGFVEAYTRYVREQAGEGADAILQAVSARPALARPRPLAQQAAARYPEAPMTETIELPRTGGPGSGLGDNWRVIVRNDDHNTFDHVALTLARTIPGVNVQKGYAYADAIHQSGQAMVWSGLKEPAELYWEQLNDAGLTMAPLEQG